MAKPRFELYSEDHLCSLTNTKLLALAEKHQKQPPILEDILHALKPRKNDRAIEARAFILPLLKWHRRKRRIWASLALTSGLIVVGVAQGFGREIFAKYSTVITNFFMQ